MSKEQRTEMLARFFGTREALRRAIRALWEAERRLARARQDIYRTSPPDFLIRGHVLSGLESVAILAEAKANRLCADLDRFLVEIKTAD